ncbi:hypothetical protein LTR12_006316 [Friedmanniomyces endolithicus]|nr:hypothetical protein LTR74_000809 [Friedmanniomyces endolithicus]KAK1819247.1 hypothetical protein LTR12_006316 [Friedmanniomyces endolithicus]
MLKLRRSSAIVGVAQLGKSQGKLDGIEGSVVFQVLNLRSAEEFKAKKLRMSSSQTRRGCKCGIAGSRLLVPDKLAFVTSSILVWLAKVLKAVCEGTSSSSGPPGANDKASSKQSARTMAPYPPNAILKENAVLFSFPAFGARGSKTFIT